MKSPPAPRRKVLGRIPALLEDNVGLRGAKREDSLFWRSGQCQQKCSHSIGPTNEKFENFCRVSRLGWPLKKEVDLILADFLDVMFLGNHSAAEGEKGGSLQQSFSIYTWRGHCFIAREPCGDGGKRNQLRADCRCHGWLPQEWRWSFVLGENASCLWNSWWITTRIWEPGESIDLKGRDIVPPVRNGGKQYRWSAIVVRDSQDHKPDKTGVFDNSVPFEQCGARVSRTASLGKGSGAEWEGREGLSIRRYRIPRELSRGWSAAGIQEFASVPKQARRCIGRLEQWRKRSSCCQGSGQVAHGPKCAKIWKGGENSKDDDRFITRTNGVLSVVSQKHREGAERDVASSPTMSQFGWQDVFSGLTTASAFCIRGFCWYS